jgi:phosphohistidine phosphatase
MTCYLVRHGTAAAGADDWTRPLTPAGRAEVEATARALAARGAEVAEIRHSGRARARETAEILGGVLTPARGIRGTPGLAPEDAPDAAAAELAGAEAPLMLVGHLPHLGRLAAALVGAAALDRIHFTPATAVGLRRGPRGWELELMVPPHGGAAS